jgi:hypothetical protein
MAEEVPNSAVKPPFRAGLGEAGKRRWSSPIQWKVSPEEPLKGVCALRVEIRPRAQDEKIVACATCGFEIEWETSTVVRAESGREGRLVLIQGGSDGCHGMAG